jgi:hypothetical protein
MRTLRHGDGNSLQIRAAGIRPRLQSQWQRDRTTAPAAVCGATARLHTRGRSGQQQREGKGASPVNASVSKDASAPALLREF